MTASGRISKEMEQRKTLGARESTECNRQYFPRLIFIFITTLPLARYLNSILAKRVVEAGLRESEVYRRH